MKNNLFVFVLLLYVFTLFTGCGGTKRPADWPDLYPCKIIVTKGGEPFGDATVTLSKMSGSANYAVGGATDTAGIAVIKTAWPGIRDEGAPAGEFKVCITKSAPFQIDPSKQAALDKMDYGQRMAESERIARDALKKALLVPISVTQAETSPITINVSSAGTELKVELNDIK